MRICETIVDLRAALAQTKGVAFVPTMGNLHAGHIALVKQAKPLAACTVASIFVNRLQFAPHEDFDNYPRTWEADCAQLEAAGCDILFAPNEAELYPSPQTFKVHPPGEMGDILEGHFRPGFFIGVCTVVMKLFACVQPRVAVFGKKDYQQITIIRNMVRQFALPIEIVAGETVRADDGLALSSRNGYLSAAERKEATRLQASLRQLVNQAQHGSAIARYEQEAMEHLRAHGWQPDYVTLRSRDDFSEVAALRAGACVVLAAARLGKTRLIDQLEC